MIEHTNFWLAKFSQMHTSVYYIYIIYNYYITFFIIFLQIIMKEGFLSYDEIDYSKKYEKKKLHVIIIIIKFSLMHAFDPTSKPIYISTAYFATKYVVGSV